MAEDVKNAMGRMSRVLRAAKEQAHAQQEAQVSMARWRPKHGSTPLCSFGAPRFGKVKEKAHRLSIGSPSGRQASERAHGADPKVEKLMALGFTAVAARHGLRASGGDLEAAVIWLLDQRNADEVLAAEVAAQEARSPGALVVGGRARVSGLRTAPSLNGSAVILRKWDEASQRWIVTLDDGSVKSIRAQNLDPLYAEGQAGAPEPAQEPAPVRVRQDEEESACAGVPEGQENPAAWGRPSSSDSVDREELKTVARQMLGARGEPFAPEVLDAMSLQDLLELIDGLSPPEQERPRADLERQSRPGTSDTIPLPRMVQGFQDGQARPDPAETLSKLELEEARLKSLAEAQSKRAEELQEREEALRLAEEQLEKKRAEVEVQRAQPVRIPFVAGPSEPETEAASPSMLEAERAELRQLREEVDIAAKELEERQQAAKRVAEERELQLLETESMQIRLASTLKEEEERLQMQRRSLGLLQQALLKGGQSRTEGYMERSLDDGADAQKHEAASACAGEEPENGEEDEVWDLDWSVFGKD
ncbi:unnamed protein product [Effrenium voratum]|nr:unnamed protein product [Effrenium voratum]